MILKYIKTNPTVPVTAFLAIGLLVLGLYSLFPVEWFGATAPTSNLVRFFFGVFILMPTTPLLYWMIKDNRFDYLDKQKRTRPYLFWMGVTYFYLAMLRILAYGFFPPLFILYLVCGLITMTIWLGVK